MKRKYKIASLAIGWLIMVFLIGWKAVLLSIIVGIIVVLTGYILVKIFGTQ